MPTYVNPGDVRILCEDAPGTVDPSRQPRRGLGITWKNGGSQTQYVYAAFVLPATGSFSIKAGFKRWSGTDASVNTDTYVDVLASGDPVPKSTTPTTVTHTTIDGYYRIVTLATGSGSLGNTVLVCFSLYNLDVGTEIVLHNLWLEM